MKCSGPGGWSRALSAFHKAPSAQWTVESLAREAGLSRTGFAQRFAQKLGFTPMQYVTSWRVKLAREALADGHMSTLAVAELAGYGSCLLYTSDAADE